MQEVIRVEDQHYILATSSRAVDRAHVLKDGDTVNSPFLVQFGLSGMGVAPAGVEKPNTGHHHLLIDTTMTAEQMKEPIPADDLVPSPDGQWVLAHVQNQLYLLAMPAVGGEAPTVSVGGPSVPLKKITDIGADYFGWADDGKTIAWASGASYFRQPLSSISFAQPKLLR